MQATVIDISEQSIYLEIDRQLRFESKYVSTQPMTAIMKSSKVNFDFSRADGVPVVVVSGVEVPTDGFSRN
jgi:hypothetical protein